MPPSSSSSATGATATCLPACSADRKPGSDPPVAGLPGPGDTPGGWLSAGSAKAVRIPVADAVGDLVRQVRHRRRIEVAAVVMGDGEEIGRGAAHVVR